MAAESAVGSFLGDSWPELPAGAHPRRFLWGLARTGLTDLDWLRGVAILITEIRGDLVGRI